MIRKLTTLIIAVALAFTGLAVSAHPSSAYGEDAVYPIFECWWPNEDGSYELFFGFENQLEVNELPAYSDILVSEGAEIHPNLIDPTVSPQYLPYPVPGAPDNSPGRTPPYPSNNYAFSVTIPERDGFVWWWLGIYWVPTSPSLQVDKKCAVSPEKIVREGPSEEAEPLFNAVLLIGESGWSAWAIPWGDNSVSIEIQMGERWGQKAVNAPCSAPVYSDNYWACDKYIPGNGGRLPVGEWMDNFLYMRK